MDTFADTFTIAAAARHCGVARRTLQRAVAAGRLPLTPEHRVTLDALAHAGYVAATVTPRPDAATPQRQTPTAPDTSQVLAQALTPLLERLDRLIVVIEALGTRLTAQSTAATPLRQGTPQRQRATAAVPVTPPPAPALMPPTPADTTPVPTFDPSKFTLGTLCPRGHDYQGTGQTLRRLPQHVCPTCDVERTRERRQAKRNGRQ